MTLRKRVMLNPQASRPALSRQPLVEKGVVVSHPKGTNRANVRLGEDDRRVIRKVVVPNDMLLNQDDQVIMCQTPGEEGWVILAAFNATRENGLEIGDVGRHLISPAPLSAVALTGVGVAFDWYTWTDFVTCFEFQWNTVPGIGGESGPGTIVYTWQNQWIVPSAVTIYARVRVIYVSEKTDGTLYGPWAGWSSATP